MWYPGLSGGIDRMLSVIYYLHTTYLTMNIRIITVSTIITINVIINKYN